MNKSLPIRILIVTSLAAGALLVLFLGCKQKSDLRLAKDTTEIVVSY